MDDLTARQPAQTPNYKFSKKISREVLENYLERSITMQRMLTGEGNFDDNLRMMKTWASNSSDGLYANGAEKPIS